MSSTDNRKPIPRSILIFGAAAHIGRPLAEFLHEEAPEIQLRLVSSKPDRCEALRRDFPYAEVVNASYFDTASLEHAAKGMEGIFVITQGGTDERLAMTNFVSAVKKAGAPIHILRTLGFIPEMDPRRIPQALREPPALGLPIQSPLAKRILDESGLPVTYLNIGATFMDNFFWMKEGLRRERKLIWHDRLIPFIDPRDLAEVAGRLFLSDNHRHLGQFHTLNNGHDLMRYSDAAVLMSEVLGEKITHDGSKESFFAAYPHLAERLWKFFEYEQDNEVIWARNDFVERMLGRKPRTLREWFGKHARSLLT